MSQLESIYSFLPKVEVKTIKAPLYRSQYRDKVKEDWKKIKKEMATFGPIVEERPHQSQYLKAGNGKARFEKNRKRILEKHVREVVKGPTYHDLNILPQPAFKDYIQRNITAADKLEPKREDPKSYYVDKPTYGQVPEYLVHFKSESKDNSLKSNKIENKIQVPQGYEIMQESERLESIALLEGKLKQLRNEYGKLSLVIDTVPKKNKKVTLENHIDEIESYLNELSSSKTVFIRVNE